ncbi:hypothetical protein PI126_g17296 [Phytophthora idaei]|nr:hypothetical protein PI126_g17296 [Phytophthora idaei]
MRSNKAHCATTECLLIMAARFYPELLSGRSGMAAVMYLHCFRWRYCLSIRRITHRGTQKRIQMEIIADDFSKTVQYSLEESNVVPHILGDAKFAPVYNMGQTAIYIDMNPNTTIDFVGTKHVDAVRGMTERVSVFLCASGTGEKLPP